MPVSLCLMYSRARQLAPLRDDEVGTVIFEGTRLRNACRTYTSWSSSQIARIQITSSDAVTIWPEVSTRSVQERYKDPQLAVPPSSCDRTRVPHHPRCRSSISQHHRTLHSFLCHHQLSVFPCVPASLFPWQCPAVAVVLLERAYCVKSATHGL